MDESFFADDPENSEQTRRIEVQLERVENLRNAFSQLFTTPNGELVLGYLASRYRVHAPLFHEGEEISELTMAMREGSREVVLDIIQRVSELAGGEMRIPKGERYE